MDMKHLEESEKFLIQKGLEELAKKFMSSAVESDSINLTRMVKACEDLSKKISSHKEESKRASADIKVRDLVEVISDYGKVLGEARVVSINEFREPSTKYAIEADFLPEIIFVGEENLVKIQEESK